MWKHLWSMHIYLNILNMLKDRYICVHIISTAVCRVTHVMLRSLKLMSLMSISGGPDIRYEPSKVNMVANWMHLPLLDAGGWSQYGRLLTTSPFILLLNFAEGNQSHMMEERFLQLRQILLQFSKIMTLAKYIFSFRHFCL